MSMTRKLWSINGLATELGRDRRTIAAALADVPADGSTTTGGHKAWFLTTCLRALDPSPTPKSHGAEDFFLESLVERMDLASWKSMQAEWDSPDPDHPDEPPLRFRLTIDEFCELCPGKYTREQVLAWLRSGCGFHREGCYESGAGFILEPFRVFDYEYFLQLVARTSPDPHAAKKLRL